MAITNETTQKTAFVYPDAKQQRADPLSVRLSGRLPHIDLAGTDFTIDWRLRELRETSAPWKNISFDSMDNGEYGEFLFFYDTQTHQLVIPAEDITELPENLVVLEIPNETQLDPIAVAREKGIHYNEIITAHPIKNNLCAKILPLSESGLPEIIAENLQKISQAGQTVSKRRR